MELTALSAATLARLRLQPGAALGSSRHLLADAEIPVVLDRLKAYEIGALFLIGGGGTMAEAQKLGQYAQTAGYTVHGQPLRVIGIPKTVDNDLAGTDVVPGYGSAARFIAQTTRDIALDLRSMRNFDDVAVLEVMGAAHGVAGRCLCTGA